MATMILDPQIAESLIEQRRAWGADKFDEVWEGVYMMAPLPTYEHQNLVNKFCWILEETLGQQGIADILAGFNLSSCSDDWKKDYRCPDVVVFLRGTQAEIHETHCCGPADFLIEITSPGDRTHEKIDFYDRIGVHELLIVNRETWALELYQRQNDKLQKTAESRSDNDQTLQCCKVPLCFKLLPGEKRPSIEVIPTVGDRKWLL